MNLTTNLNQIGYCVKRNYQVKRTIKISEDLIFTIRFLTDSYPHAAQVHDITSLLDSLQSVIKNLKTNDHFPKQ